MKKLIKTAACFLPSCLWMAVIYRFSDTPAVASTKQSISVTGMLLDIIGRYIMIAPQKREMLIGVMEPHIRKLAHMAEYGLLFLLLVFPMLFLFKKKAAGIIAAFSVCFLYACSDEFHQLFVEGRSGSLRDVGIDMLGVSASLVLFLLAASLVYLNRKGREK